MNQLSINFARDLGRTAADACTAKAETQGFDTEGAKAFVLRYLALRGNTPGEILTDLAIAHGFTVQDQRAYGAVFAGLARRGLIRCVGYCERQKGHGCAGGRIWAATA